MLFCATPLHIIIIVIMVIISRDRNLLSILKVDTVSLMIRYARVKPKTNRKNDAGQLIRSMNNIYNKLRVHERNGARKFSFFNHSQFIPFRGVCVHSVWSLGGRKLNVELLTENIFQLLTLSDSSQLVCAHKFCCENQFNAVMQLPWKHIHATWSMAVSCRFCTFLT